MWVHAFRNALVPVVTAFTVAHSVTLIASAYDLAPDALPRLRGVRVVAQRELRQPERVDDPRPGPDRELGQLLARDGVCVAVPRI